MNIAELIVYLAALADRDHVKLKGIILATKDYSSLIEDLGGKICRLDDGTPIIYIDSHRNYMKILEDGRREGTDK